MIFMSTKKCLIHIAYVVIVIIITTYHAVLLELPGISHRQVVPASLDPVGARAA